MRSVLLIGLMAASLAAQSTLYVGIGGFSDLDAALAAASPGDTIVVDIPLVAPFDCNIGVTLVSTSATTVSTGLQGATATTSTFHIPAGQELHLVRFGFRCNVDVQSGRATLRDGELLMGATTTPGQPSFEVRANASVHLQNYSLRGLLVPPRVAGDLTMSRGVIDSTFPGVALEVAGGRVQVDSATLRSISTFGGADVVRLRNGGRASFCDCELTAPAGFCAFDADASSSVRTHRCVITQSGAGCSASQPGPLLAASSTAHLLAGSTYTIDYVFEPQSFVAVFAGPRLDTVSWAPVIEQPTWLEHSSGFAAALLLTDAQGRASASFAIPVTALSYPRIWFVGVGGPALPLQASVPVGGVVR